MFLNMYKKALDVLMKKPVMLWGLSLLSGFIGLIASLVTIGIPALSFAISYLLTCGMAKLYLDGLQGKEVNSDQIFAAFNKNCLRTAGGMAWKQLWIILWCLIPIAGPVIAIVKSYSYSFVPYILMTKPEVSATQALRLSMKMTNGKKGQMFLADLCVYGGLAVIFLVLYCFSFIPFIGGLFTLVQIVVAIVAALFLSIFAGLYRAAFYRSPARVMVERELPENF